MMASNRGIDEVRHSLAVPGDQPLRSFRSGPLRHVFYRDTERWKRTRNVL